MGNLQDFSGALTNWSFGIIILVGLVTSDFLGSEVIVAILLAAFTSTLSALCGTASIPAMEQFRRRKSSNVLYFLIIWLDVLIHLVAAAMCARFASATVDYISRGHFREFLFGIESHSLGEPWPDVLGVTIVVVVAILFMLGLEKSPIISCLLFITLIGAFVFFTTVGSFHTIVHFWRWCENFKVHSMRSVTRAAALCSFAFVKDIPKSPRNNCLKLFTMVFNPVVFYLVVSIVFSLMTHRRELAGTALPLIQVFEHRDVDWARPIMAILTICVVCLVITEVMPLVFQTFVQLASRDWQIFVSSMQYQSSLTGAPVLAIFAAGSLAAILAFACPLSHLIKLLNSSCLLKCLFNSTQLLYNRYKPEIYQSDCLVYHTNVQYSKLNQNVTKPPTNPAISCKLKSILGLKPTYISRSTTSKVNKTEERECLLLDDYSNKSITISEDSQSENDEEMGVRSEDEESGDTTDIDLIVQEYKEGLQVSTVGQFNNNRKPSTTITSLTVMTCLVIINFVSVCVALYILKYVHILWPYLFGLVIPFLVILFMPQNAEDKAKEAMLPSKIYTTCLLVSIVVNIVLISTIIHAIWQGIVFWLFAGCFLFWRCDCCTCDGLFTVYRNNNRINASVTHDIVYEYKDNYADTIYITR